MKRLLLPLLLLIGFTAQAQYRDDSYQDLFDTEVVSHLKEHIGFVSSAALEGRKAGSEGEREAAIYVTEALESCGVDVLSGSEGDFFGMKMPAGDTLRSRNVIGFIPGYDKTQKNKYIVIGARLDNHGVNVMNLNGESVERVYYGANGNGSGLALLIELARRLSSNRVLLKRSVLIVAFGASLEMNAGSWYFLNRAFDDAANIDAMINLDMLGTASNGFYAYTSSNLEMNNLLEAMKGTLQPIQPQVVPHEPVPSDHRSFYDKEIPSVFFTTGMYPEYNTDRDTASIIEYEDMEREMEYIYNFALELINGRKLAFRKEDILERRLSDREAVPWHECDTKPLFLGSPDPKTFLSKWVYVYLKYPEDALREGVQGRVQVDFIIDEKGKVCDVKLGKGTDPDLDEEALRIVSASPDWKPAKVRGQKVKCSMSVYVEFRLEKKKK